MTMPRHLIGWFAGLLSTIFALGMVLNQFTFDTELIATEARLIHNFDGNDRRIIEQLLDTQKLLVGQQQQQFLTLRRELIEQQLSSLRHQYEASPDEHKPLMIDRVHALERRLEEINNQLQQMLLKPKSSLPDAPQNGFY